MLCRRRRDADLGESTSRQEVSASPIPRPDLSARPLQMTCQCMGTEGAETVLRIELVPKGGGTEVRLTYTGFVSETSRDGHEENWPLALEILDEALS